LKTTITIARQLGSGGSYIGQLVAKQLGFKYIDREVLHLAAREFGCAAEELAPRAERVSSFWERFFKGLTLGPPETHYAPPPLRAITDRQLFEKQTEILRTIAKKSECVIVGWGGCHVLPRHRKKLNIFCHAPMSFRVRRVMEVYGVQAEAESREMINESDEMRQRYILEMTGKDWACAENYHLSLDTSLFSFDENAQVIIEFFRRKDEKRPD
jgi:cytidylate kinase